MELKYRLLKLIDDETVNNVTVPQKRTGKNLVDFPIEYVLLNLLLFQD